MPFGMSREEWLFGLLISSVHGIQHVFLRLIPPIIPILVVDFAAPLWQLGLLVSVYMFAGGVFQAPMGMLSDRMDRRYLLVPAITAMSVGYLIFVSATAVGTVVPSIYVVGYEFTGPFVVMAFGMFVGGLGFSGVHPVGYPLISANTSVANKGKVLGMWGSASKIGDATAPILVGVLILVTTWEVVLVILGVFGLLYATGLFFVLRAGSFETTPPTDTQPDDAAADVEWRDVPQVFLIPISVMVVFFFLVMFATNGMITYTPVYVSDVYGYSFSLLGVTFQPESVANFYFAIMLISGAVSQLIVGASTDRYDTRTVLIGLLVVSALGLAALSLLTVSPLVLLIVFVVLGWSLFGVNPARDALISNITPAAYEGRTFGYLWTITLVGTSGYPVIIGYLAETIGIQASFGLLAAGPLIGIVVIALLYSPRVYRDRRSVPTHG